MLSACKDNTYYSTSFIALEWFLSRIVQLFQCLSLFTKMFFLFFVHAHGRELMRQNLSGVLPEEVVNLTYLTNLDLSRNFIQGPIPASWASLPVFNLSLQGNRISGTVPKELGRMPFLKSM
jgi:hypothetical protein